ncbi:MAG TPA: hypothetical protein VJN39_14795 [Gemmatimonadales bacterium]|nr:hypothetical protein [Gemmatimonadales bacterium]
MAQRHDLHPAQLEALRMLIEYSPEALLDMLVSHGPGCAHHAAAHVVLTMAKWSKEDLIEAAVARLSQELGE